MFFISDDVENSDGTISANCNRGKSPEKKIEKKENLNDSMIKKVNDSKKGPTGETPIVVLSDDSGDESSKNKKKGSLKKASNVDTKESKPKASSQHKQHYEEDVSDSEIFGLKNDKSDNKEEENSEDDMWVGLDDKESTVSKNMKKSKEDNKGNNYDLKTPENSQKSVLQHNLDSHQKELKGYKKETVKSLHSTKYSQRKSFLEPKTSDVIKNNIEQDEFNNSKIDTADNNSALEMVVPEEPVFVEGADCDIPTIVSSPVSDLLIEQELVEDSSSIGIPVENLVTENQLTVNNFFVEGPVIEAFPVERSTTEDISEILDKEGQPVSLPLIPEVSSLNNEDSCNEKFVDNVKEGLDLGEDFQSIERNWTQQIEEEMKQDSVLLKIESDNRDSINISSRQWFNVDDNEITSKELTHPKSIDKSEYKESKNPGIVDSFQTLDIDQAQNDILLSDELKNMSRNLEIDRKDILTRSSTNVSLEGDDSLEKDNTSHFDNSQNISPESEKKCEDDLIISAGTHTEIIVEQSNVSFKREFESTKDATNKGSLEVFEVAAEIFKNQSVIFLKDDKDKQSEVKATLNDPEKPSNFINSNVSHLNAELTDQQSLEKDFQIKICEDNNDNKTTVTILSSQENVAKQSGNNFKTDKEKNVCLETSSTNTSIENNRSNILSNIHQPLLCRLQENIMTNKNGNISTDKNFASEKCELPVNNLVEINIISLEAETKNLSEDIGQYSDKYLESFSKKSDSLTPLQVDSLTSLKVDKNETIKGVSLTITSKPKVSIGTKITDYEETQRLSTLNVDIEENKIERGTNITKIYDKDCSKKETINQGNMFVIGDTTLTSQDEMIKSGSHVPKVTSESEVQPSRLSTTSEHGEGSKKASTLERVSAQPGEKDSGNSSEVGDLKVVDGINEIDNQVESNNLVSSSEAMKDFKSAKQEGNHVGTEASDQVLAGSKVDSSLLNFSDNLSQLNVFKKNNLELPVEVKTDDKVLAGSKVTKESSKAINQFSNISPNFSDNSYQLDVKQMNFGLPVEVINSANIVHGSDQASNNILNDVNTADEDNVSKINPVACEGNVHEDKKEIEEKISLCVDKDVCPNIDPLDCELNNTKIDVYNESSLNNALTPHIKEINCEVQNIKNAENDSKQFLEKSFFFGKEDIETYIRSTKATFQIGGRMSLPEEDEPVDPMEVAMIEDEEKLLTQPSPTEPDIDLSLHLSPDHLKKPKKVDQGMVTENSYLQRRARKLKKTVKKLLPDESCDEKLENKIIVNSDHISNILSVEKDLKCISTQTSDVVFDEIDLSEEEKIDYTKMAGPSQKSVELKKKVNRKIRQSSEPPLTHKEDLKRKTSICSQKSDEFYDAKEEPYVAKRHSRKLLQEQDVKGVLKNKDAIENLDEELKTQSKVDHWSVRRSRRLSECVTETNELQKNQCEKDLYIKTQRRSRGYSEEPDFYRTSTYKNKESAGYISSENENEIDRKCNAPKQRRSRRYSEEPEMRSILKKNLEKEKVQNTYTTICNEYTSRRRSKKFSEEPEVVNKYLDERRRNSKHSDYSDDFSNLKQSDETERRGILKKSSKGSRKVSLSCEMLNELKHYEEAGSCQENRKLRSQSEEPELLEIPKKRHRQSRRNSYTHETAADFDSRVKEIPIDNKKILKHSEDNELHGILKKRISNKSRSVLSEVDSEMRTFHQVDQSEGSRKLGKHSESEIQGILKKGRKECRSSDNETEKLNLLSDDVLPERNRRSRRHSEEPEMLKTHKKRERRSSQSSNIDNEFNLQEGIRRIRRHSEEPEVRGIMKKRISVSRKSSYTTEIDGDLKLNEDLPYEGRKSKDQLEETEVKGILQKNKSNRRKNLNTDETDKDFIQLERDSPKHKRSNISRKTDLINCAKIQDNEFDEEYFSDENILKNQTCSYVFNTSDKNDERSSSGDISKIVNDGSDEPKKRSRHTFHSRLQIKEKDARLNDDSEETQKVRDDDNKDVGFLSSEALTSENKKMRRFNPVLHEEHQSVKGSPAKVRRRSSSTTIAKEETVDIISEGESRNIRKSLRRTPDKKEVSTNIVEERKRKVEPEKLKFVPKRLDYSDDDSPEKKKSRSLIDFPIKRNSRLPRPALEDIREEDEDLLKKKKKSFDDFHLEEMKKKASKKTSVAKLVIGDSDVDSDVSTPVSTNLLLCNIALFYFLQLNVLLLYSHSFFLSL